MKSPSGMLGLVALSMLAACGSGQQDPLVTAVRTIGAGVFGSDEEGPSGPALTAETLPPSIVDQVDGPLILVETTRLGGTTLMTQVGRNDQDATWRSPEGWGITLGDGALVRSSRGLGFDLMASEVSATRASLTARRAGPVERVMVHLDGEGQERRALHHCIVTMDGTENRTIVGQTRALTRMTETCTTEAAARYENIYWLDAGGQAVQSLQWISPEIGHMQITLLRDR